MTNWSIHHNVFYGIMANYPGEIVRSQVTGLHNVKFYNNTIEYFGTITNNIIGTYGGTSQNVEIKNNLILNYQTAYNWYPNRMVYLENSTMNGLQVMNNYLVNQPAGTVPGTYAGNIIGGDPKISKSGNRPRRITCHCRAAPDRCGINVGLPYQGTAPDIGAYEYGSGVITPPNAPPTVSISSPANNATFVEGNAITINANASDTGGTVSRVEFFSGNTKLGEDLSSSS